VATGTNPNAGNSSRNSPPNAGTPARQDWLSLNELGFKGWGGGGSKDKPLAFEGEPERGRLTEPPPGYQTPAPGAAYGVVADRPEDKAWRLPDWFDRTQKNNDRH